MAKKDHSKTPPSRAPRMSYRTADMAFLAGSTSAKKPNASGIDWHSLLRAAEEFDRVLSGDDLAMWNQLWRRGILDGNGKGWAHDYVDAVESAIRKHDGTRLRAMLRAEVPIPPFLLPYLERALGRSPGAPGLTTSEDAAIRDYFDRVNEHGLASESEAKRDLAKIKRVHKKTIDRSLKRTEPDDKD